MEFHPTQATTQLHTIDHEINDFVAAERKDDHFADAAGRGVGAVIERGLADSSSPSPSHENPRNAHVILTLSRAEFLGTMVLTQTSGLLNLWDWGEANR